MVSHEFQSAFMRRDVVENLYIIFSLDQRFSE